MSSEKGKTFAFWLSFFRGAGIMPSYDSKYSLVFDENRIRPDMLLDLTKECLRDMEITAMGDIIAILRHAKKTHEQSKTLAFENEKQTTGTEKAIGSASSTSAVVSPAPTKTSALKSSDKVTTTTPALSSSATTSKVSATPTPQTSKEKSTSNVFKSTDLPRKEKEAGSLAKLSSKVNSGTPSQAAKGQKRIIIVNRESSSDSDSAQKQQKDTPAQKKPRVAEPEKTPRVERLLNNRLGPSVCHSKPNSTDTKGVFSRLGSECVSAAATIIRPSTSAAKSASTERSGRESPMSPSVFQRLGGRGSGTGNYSDASSSRRSTEHDRHESTRRDERGGGSRGRDERDDRSRLQRTTSGSVEGVRRIKLRDDFSVRERHTSPPVSRVFRFDRMNSSRMRSDSNGGGRREERSDLRSRLSSSHINLEPSRGTRKIISTSSIKNTRDLHVGQVLKTTRIQRSDGKSIVQRVIVKKVPKGRGELARFRGQSPESLSEIDDPLAQLFDD